MIDQLCLAKFLQFTVVNVKANVPGTVEGYYYWLAGEVIRYLAQVYPDDVKQQSTQPEVKA